MNEKADLNDVQSVNIDINDLLEIIRGEIPECADSCNRNTLNKLSLLVSFSIEKISEQSKLIDKLFNERVSEKNSGISNMQSVAKMLERVAEWFETTPKYPYAATVAEEKSRDNTLAKADLAWRLCSDGRQIASEIRDLLSVKDTNHEIY